MNINTKFNIDDKVFTIDFEQKKLMVGYIEKINIVVEQHSNVSRATINYEIGAGLYNEDRLFASADEACASLKNEISWIQ
jgi:hypothetical protein